MTGEEGEDGTQNPLLAAAYADVLVAFRQERLRRDPEEPALWILELGASSGRFAYHLLLQLAALCERQGLNVRDFRYVLTPVREANLETWLAHPRFQPDLASGQLEMARFDVLAPAPLELRPSGERLGPGDLRAPLVVIANSVLNTIPAELLRFREGMVERGLVRLGGLPQGGPAANTAEAELGELEKGGAEASLAPLERLELDFGAEPMAAPAFGDPRLDGLLAGLEETWLLFPALTPRTLEWLAALSSQGVLLLSAGEGQHRLEQVLRPQPSGLVWHQGRFSVRGNNHALGGWAEAAGGPALAPLASPGGLHPFALLRLPQAAEHRATIAAWRRHLGAFSPSDYLSLSQLARANADQLSAEPLLVFLRLGQGDRQLFLRLLPRLRELLPGLVEEERLALLECVAQVGTMHFPLDSAEQKAMAEGVQALLRAVEAAPEPWQPRERQGGWAGA